MEPLFPAYQPAALPVVPGTYSSTSGGVATIL